MPRMIRFTYGGVLYEVAARRLTYDPRLRRLLKHKKTEVWYPVTKRTAIPTRIARVRMRVRPKASITKKTFRRRRRWSRAAILKTRPITRRGIDNLMKMAEKHNIAADLIDWHSVVDKSLTYAENKSMIKKMLMIPEYKVGGEKRQYVNGLMFKASYGNHLAEKELKQLKKEGWI